MHWRGKRQPTPVFLPGESQDGGAWWAAVYGVAQSRTRLKRLSSSSSRKIFGGFLDSSVGKESACQRKGRGFDPRAGKIAHAPGQPTRLPRPWDSPGKNTGVGCHVLLQCMKVKSESEVVQLCPTLHNPMGCSPPGSPVHGIFQARVLEWVAIAFSNYLC